MSTKLTTKQVEYLKACASKPMSSWDAGAATVSLLRKLGFISKASANGCACNVITDAGREWLDKEGNNARS